MKSFIIILLTLLLNIVGYSQILEYPQKMDVDNQIITHKGFTLSYNETCEQANWVKYMVTESDLENKVAERKNKFTEDTSIKTKSALPSDYYKSGYDRGHLAPSASFVHNQELNDETFLMSNMSPQDPSFNRGMWKKLEEFERQTAIERDTIYVITGPVLEHNLEVIGENKVCVPKEYYKILIDVNGKIIGSYLMKNEKLSGNVNDYKQPIEVIQTVTGFKFVY